MTKAYRNYVDGEVPKDQKKVLVQARITPELWLQVEAICKMNKWKTSHAVRGGLKKFIDDCASKPDRDFNLERIFMESLSAGGD